MVVVVIEIVQATEMITDVAMIIDEMITGVIDMEEGE